MDYSKLSDQEINLLVAKIEHPGRTIIESKSRPPSVLLLNGVNTWFDYCNNAADAWPVILGNKISIVKDMKGLWWAAANAYWIDGVEWQIDGEPDENPLRAAMIVFLMMQDANHANP